MTATKTKQNVQVDGKRYHNKPLFRFNNSSYSRLRIVLLISVSKMSDVQLYLLMKHNYKI